MANGAVSVPAEWLQDYGILKEQFKQLRTLLDEATSSNHQLASDKEVFAEQLQRVGALLDAKCREFDELLESYRSLSSERSQSGEEVRSRVAGELAAHVQLCAHDAELREFRAAHVALKQEMLERDAACERELERKAQELEELVHHYERRIGSLEGSNADLLLRSGDGGSATKVALLESQTRDLQSRVTVLKEELETLQGSYERVAREKDAVTQVAATQIDDLRRALQEATLEATRQRSAATAAEEARALEAEESQRLHQELLGLQADASHLRAQLETVNSYFASERSLLEQSARERLDASERLRTEAQANLADCQRRLTLAEERADLIASCEAAVLRNAEDDVKAAHLDAEQRCAEAEARMAEALAELDSALARQEADGARWQATIEGLQREAHQVDAVRRTQCDEVRELCGTSERLQRRLEQDATERDDARRDASRLAEQLEHAEARIQDLLQGGEGIERLKMQLEYSQQEAERLSAEVVSARREATDGLLKVRTAAARERETLEAQAAEARREAARALKALAKHKVATNRALVHAQQHHQKLLCRRDESDARREEAEHELGLATQALRTLGPAITAASSPLIVRAGNTPTTEAPGCQSPDMFNHPAASAPLTEPLRRATELRLRAERLRFSPI
jgi:chromosome segregation ATPase